MNILSDIQNIKESNKKQQNSIRLQKFYKTILMEINRKSQSFSDEQIQSTNQVISLAQYSQTHPYQYLKQLNNVYQNCNKSNSKDYSIASMIKLPWKKFKTISIPKCFEQSYNLQKKQIFIQKNQDDNQKSQQVQKQKKFWKQHQELMKKYYRNNIINHNLKKQKMLERRHNLISAKSYISLNHNKQTSKNSLSYASNKSKAYQTMPNMVQGKQNKQNNEERMQTLKTQSDQSQSTGLCQSKQFILNNQKEKSHWPSNMFKQRSNNKQTTLNKVPSYSKSTKKSKLLQQSISVEQQVLLKLKKISMMPHLNRAKTANILSRQGRIIRQRQRLQNIDKKYISHQSLQNSRIKQGEYLQFNMKQQLINRYKNKIQQIDCSISQKNVKKTAQILKQMQQLVNVDISKY